MARGVLEQIDRERWRLTVEHDDGSPPDVFEGPLRLLLDVIEDLSVDVREVRRLGERS
jgi:hypothetical protein